VKIIVIFAESFVKLLISCPYKNISFLGVASLLCHESISSRLASESLFALGNESSIFYGITLPKDAISPNEINYKQSTIKAALSLVFQKLFSFADDNAFEIFSLKAR
jgi:hypothetical protein